MRKPLRKRSRNPRSVHMRRSPSKGAFVEFLRGSLIPDLMDSGRTETAKDLNKCADMISGQYKYPRASKARFARWLKSTLIPDLKASGMKYTAADFSKCVRYIEKEK